MRDGERCRLDVSTWDASPSQQQSQSPYATVIGVVVGERRHLDDATRVLYYFHTIRIERSVDAVTAERSGGSSSGGLLQHHRREKREELSVGPHALSSAGGFKYSFDGWYDEIFLYKIDEDPLEPLPREWRVAMEQDTSPCELLYLCYASRPWFQSPFASLQYVQMPDRHLCYSVSVCHRCLSPFVSQQQLQEHLLGYCQCRRPPGVLLYDDTKCGRRVYYVDGAQQLHYGRCLCLLGKSFLESKQVENDVDIYEFFVVTTPRASLPYVVGEMDEAAFRREAAHFDEAQWDGDVVVGYFSRIKHTPDHCLSCIVTLPVFQQQGLGFFMLDVAYSLTALRQRLCGCAEACGSRGGAISRPFSPHGQAMLMAYWRRRVTAALLQHSGTAPTKETATVASAPPTATENGGEKGDAGGGADAAAPVPFSGIHAKVLAGCCCIHMEDLRFYAFNDERCFYARTTPDVAAPVASTKRKAADNNNNNNSNNGENDGPLEFVPPPSEFIGSLLLFKSDAPSGTGKPGSFDERFWVRDADGRRVYNRTLFHY